MPLASGTRLGPYEILEPIGKGGMGEVYRARDTKLDRDVAIKVLPEEFAQDAERLARFEREAKLLASLNHTNIASIHGFEESDGVNALVLELVEGPTLAERIEQGPILVEEAIAIAKQIADALEAGHEAGVIHRDLKPANIKLKEDGTVKVLDYGLAKALEGETPSGADSDLSQSPTLTRQGTQVGVILGTAAYMSPEQAKGKRVDRKSDLFSFGAVLFEMLTGERAFAAGDVSETLALVLTRDIDWNKVPKDTPLPIRRLLRRALEKDPRQRLADAADARLELQDAELDTRAEGGAPEPASRSGGKVWALVATFLCAVLAVILVQTMSSTAPRALVTFTLSFAGDEAMRLLGAEPTLATTPDGSRIVYVSGVRGQREIRVRPMDRLATEVVVTGDRTSTLSTPFVSPDGEWIGYRDGDELKKVPLSGGEPIAICRVPASLRGASWGDDGTIIFASGRRDTKLYRVSADGGEPDELTSPESESHRWPHVLPGGRDVLFTVRGHYGETTRIAILSLDTGEVRDLVDVGDSGGHPQYAPSGHLLYGYQDGLWAIAFDLGSLEVHGQPRRVAGPILTRAGGASEYAISRSGALAYVRTASGALQENRLLWVDRDGVEEALGAVGTERFADASVSPDGSKLAVWIGTPAVGELGDIWIYDVERGARIRLSTAGGRHPVWTPDGLSVVYEVEGEGLYLRRADAGDPPVRWFSSEQMARTGSWRPDGSVFTFVQPGEPSRTFDIWLLDRDGNAEPWITTPYDEDGPMFSPSGQWVAFVSDETGVMEVYVRAYPGPGGTLPISVGGGRAPQWSPSGDELYYRDLDGSFLSVSIEDGDGSGLPFVAKPEVVLEAPYLQVGQGDPHYDVAPDGRFLVIDESWRGDGAASSEIIVTLNWLEELERLVPTQ